MIGALVREQFRAHRAYAAWTGALLAFAVAFATFAWITNDTRAATFEAAFAVTGGDRLYHAWFAEDPAGVDEALRVADDAVAQGSDAIALGYPGAAVVTAVDRESSDPFGVVAFAGLVDWDALLVDGTAPRPGQIAVSATDAARNGWAIGDAVTLRSSGSYDPADPSIALTVSGTIRSSVSIHGSGPTIPAAIVAPDDVPIIARAVASALDPESGAAPIASLHWTVDAPALASQEGYDVGWYGAEPPRDLAWTLSFIAVLALVVGMVAMGFAVGRAQARAQTTWLATARALGARRSSIVIAAVGASAIVAVAAIAVGLGLGIAAAYGMYAADRSGVVSPLGPTGPALEAATLATIAVTALVFALVVGAIPAFWAARVEPAAALKPVADVGEAEASRRVSIRPVVWTWSASMAALLVSAVAGWDASLGVVGVVGIIAAAVTTIALMVELPRRVAVAWGRRLARSRSSWGAMAGEALAARPREAATPAFVIALSVGVLGTAGAVALYMFALRSLPYAHEATSASAPPLLPDDGATGVGLAAVVLSIVAVVTVGIALAGRNSRAAETGALGAMGLDATSAGRAEALRMAATHAIGIGFGVALAILLFGASALSFDSDDWRQDGATLTGAVLAEAWARGLVAILIVAGVAAVAAALASAAVAYAALRKERRLPVAAR